MTISADPGVVACRVKVSLVRSAEHHEHMNETLLQIIPKITQNKYGKVDSKDPKDASERPSKNKHHKESKQKK